MLTIIRLHGYGTKFMSRAGNFHRQIQNFKLHCVKSMVKMDLKGLEEHVKSYMSNYNDPSHDWSHIVRVRRMANAIALQTNIEHHIRAPINRDLVDIAALLHDVGDSKYLPEGSSMEDELRRCMNAYGVAADLQDSVVWIVPRISYGYETQHPFDASAPLASELGCVQDADRLDAIGAIGIARCFSFNGARNLLLYDPNVAPLTDLEMKSGAYKAQKGKGNARNHFYEKLLLLAGMMKTDAGKREAEQRQQLLQSFIGQFDIECDLQSGDPIESE